VHGYAAVAAAAAVLDAALVWCAFDVPLSDEVRADSVFSLCVYSCVYLGHTESTSSLLVIRSLLNELTMNVCFPDSASMRSSL
jgi:hypothetical protein